MTRKNNKSGVYQIQCLVKNNKGIYKRYIGSTKNLRIRWNNHQSDLENNTHFNNPLQNAYNKYGKENFVFEVLEYCKPKDCIEREQAWLDLFPKSHKYNIREIAESNLGVEFSEEHRRKISEALLGKIVSDKTRERLSLAMRGKNHPNWGQHHSEETIQKLSEAKMGENNPMYGKSGKEHHNAKPIEQIDLRTNKIIKIWNCARDVTRELEISYQNIWKVCQGKRKSAGGFGWKYVDNNT